MKNFTLSLCFVVLTSSILTLSSCKKQDQEQNKPIESTIGQWTVIRVQKKIFYNNVFTQDTILPKYTGGTPYFVKIESNGNFTYSYKPVYDMGTYTFKGTDSLVATTPGNNYNWKMLTLNDVLFTAMNTTTNDAAFPGAKVETYYTFTR